MPSAPEGHCLLSFYIYIQGPIEPDIFPLSSRLCDFQFLFIVLCDCVAHGIGKLLYKVFWVWADRTERSFHKNRFFRYVLYPVYDLPYPFRFRQTAFIQEPVVGAQDYPAYPFRNVFYRLPSKRVGERTDSDERIGTALWEICQPPCIVITVHGDSVPDVVLRRETSQPLGIGGQEQDIMVLAALTFPEERKYDIIGDIVPQRINDRATKHISLVCLVSVRFNQSGCVYNFPCIV